MKRFNFVIVILALLVLVGLYWSLRQNSPEDLKLPQKSKDATNTPVKKKNADDIDPKPLKTHTKQEPHSHDHSHSNDASNNSASNQIPDFDATNEEVFELANNYPESRPRLLEIAQMPNPFYENNIEVAPHSVQDIKQQEFGSIKVMAVRTLVSKEANKAQALENLDDVIRNAEDPTIVKIAQAMKKSVKNNRDFVKDFTDAVDSMSIEKEKKSR